MRFTWVLFLGFIAPLGAQNWDPALKELHLDVSDFSLRHDGVDDPFQLALTLEFLDKPLEVPAKSYALFEQLRLSATPSVLLERQASFLFNKAQQIRPLLKLELQGSGKAIFKQKIFSLTQNQDFAQALLPLAEAAASAQNKIREVLAAWPQSKQEEFFNYIWPELVGKAARAPQLDSSDQTWWEQEAKIFTRIEEFPLPDVIHVAIALQKEIEISLPELVRLAQALPGAFTGSRMSTAWGDIVIGGKARDQYQDKALLAIDPGGDDVYDFSLSSPSLGSVNVIIDLDGHDRYLSGRRSASGAPGAATSGSGNQGSGIFGIDLLIDKNGDDSYAAKEMAQGVGVFGVGVLWDMAGNDFYQARALSQGAGIWGLGLLLDDQGMDHYVSGYLSQGVGLPGGCGLLQDRRGNDVYTAGGYRLDPRGWMESYGEYKQGDVSLSLSQGLGQGWRDRAAGGIGILSDLSGNDIYQIDYFGQGAGYWLGLGLFYDGAGNDRYLARRYSQGSGVHLAAGVLLDEFGNDFYSSWAVSQGAGHDYSLGLLWDRAGNDTYAADPNGFLQQGVSNAGAVGLLVDSEGRDQHAVNPSTSLGFSGWDEKRQAAGIALFVDAKSNEDFLAQPLSLRPFLRKNKEGGPGLGLWQKEEFDTGVLPGPREPGPMEPDYFRSEIEEESALAWQRLNAAKKLSGRAQISEFLAVASGWGLSHEAAAEAEQLFWESASNKENLPLLISLLDPHDVFAALNLVEVFAYAQQAGIKALMDNLTGLDEKKRSRALYILSELRATQAGPILTQGLKDPAWKVRLQSSRGLSRLVDKDYQDKLEKLHQALKSFDQEKIKEWFGREEKIDLLNMLFALGLEPEHWVYYFSGLPQDPPSPQQVEYAVNWLSHRQEPWRLWLAQRLEALKQGQNLAQYLPAAAQDVDRDVRRWAVVGLARAQSPELCRNGEAFLSDPDFTVRMAAVRGLAKNACPQLKKLAKKSPNERVRALANQSLSIK